MANKRIIASGALLVGGGAIGRQTLIWAWDGLLDLLSAGLGKTVTWATFPWANAFGVVLMLIGLGVLIWPRVISLFVGRPDDLEARVTKLELAGEAVAESDAAKHLRGIAMLRELDKLRQQIARSKVAIETAKARQKEVLNDIWTSPPGNEFEHRNMVISMDDGRFEVSMQFNDNDWLAQPVPFALTFFDFSQSAVRNKPLLEQLKLDLRLTQWAEGIRIAEAYVHQKYLEEVMLTEEIDKLGMPG